MVGHRPLEASILVRVQVPQLQAKTGDEPVFALCNCEDSKRIDSLAFGLEGFYDVLSTVKPRILPIRQNESLPAGRQV